MASTDVDKCSNYPEFAIICSFIDKFGEKISTEFPNIGELQDGLEKTDEGNSFTPYCTVSNMRLFFVMAFKYICNLSYNHPK